jgi:rRNA biogenesis protein RRP5
MARHVEGRSTLKELCDDFLPDPKASFPMGRLVIGKVKEVRDAPKKSKNSKDPVKIQVDVYMRESTLLEQKKKLTFDDIEMQGKYKGTVTRIEHYGVFVQIENSNVSNLTHMSQCSDKFIKNLKGLYDPGDLVKIPFIKKDNESKNLCFSIKASHFENDEDSDDDSSASDSSQDDQDMVDVDDISRKTGCS